MQDPSYDPYGFAKVATRAASSEGGSADACPSNVQDFFQTIFSLANTSDGLNQINTDMNLCSDSAVSSYDQVNQTLAQYVQMQWVSAVTHDSLLDIAVIDMLNSSTIGKTYSAVGISACTSHFLVFMCSVGHQLLHRYCVK